MRWAIVCEVGSGTRCACELSDVVEVSPPLLSHHLKVLREAGLIAGTKRGRWIHYALNNNALADLFAWADNKTAASRQQGTGADALAAEVTGAGPSRSGACTTIDGTETG